MAPPPTTVREHFESPEVVAASAGAAGTGLWDVERCALGAAGVDVDDGVISVAGDVGNDDSSGALGAVLVDLGCGAGRVSIALAAMYEEIVLMDLSPRMLAVATAAVTEVRGGAGGISAHRLDVLEDLSAPHPSAPEAQAWSSDLCRADLALAANLLCYIRGRSARVGMLRTLLAHLHPDARLLVTNHVVPPEGVQELRDVVLNAGENPDALGEDALLDTTSQDGSFVHWFTPESLVNELRSAAGIPVDLHVAEDGLRAAAVLRGMGLRAVHGAR